MRSQFKPIEKLSLLEANQELQFLIKKIKYYDELYYNQNISEISDTEYDKLRQRLIQIETKYPVLKSSDSPSIRIGAPVNSKFSTVTHKYPMLSLPNAFNKNDIEKFIEKAVKYLDIPTSLLDYCCEQKIDGLSVSIVYQDGVLKYASTRGDGYIGENITQNVLQVQNIPLTLGKDFGRTEVRGEIYISRKTFIKLNEERELLGNTPFVSPRNVASGSLRQLDPTITASRKLKFFAYYINSDTSEKKTKTQVESLELLKSLNFDVCNYKYTTSIDGFIQYCQEIQAIRDTLDYEIDGTVLKINSLDLQQYLGFIGRNPRHSIAYKFSALQVIASVKDIEINIGRTGKVTPIAVLEPIRMQGVTISRVTLHNFKEIMNKNLSIGDKIIIERSGDVIPKIISIYEKCEDSQQIKLPTYCPSCNTQLIKSTEAIDWFCPNHYSCKSQVVQYLTYFTSKPCFDIKGLGKKQIKELYEIGLVKQPIDIFTLEYKQDTIQLSNRCGWGQVSVNNLFKSINQRRIISLTRFITALGIPEIGGRLASKLANHFRNIDSFLNASQAELESIPGLGKVKIASILQFLKTDINISFISQIQNYVKISPLELDSIYNNIAL